MVFGNSSSKKKKRRKTITKNKDAVGGEDNDIGNDLRLDNHSKWLELCRLKESNIKACGSIWKGETNNYDGYNSHQIIIECPNHSDILSGRGHGINRHPGNTVLRTIVVSKLDEYIKLKSSVSELTQLTWDVVHLLKHEYGARFLKEEINETDGNLGCWVEISDEEARRKVRFAFRDKVKAQKQLEKQETPHESHEQQQSPMVISSSIQPPMMMMATIDNNDLNNDDNNNNAGAVVASNEAIKRTFTTSIKQEDQQSIVDLFHPRHHETAQQVEADTVHSSSMFLSMTGDTGCGGCGGSVSNSSSTSSIGKKRQLQTNMCFNYFDCTN